MIVKNSSFLIVATKTMMTSSWRNKKEEEGG